MVESAKKIAARNARGERRAFKGINDSVRAMRKATTTDDLIFWAKNVEYWARSLEHWRTNTLRQQRLEFDKLAEAVNK